jgi:hypothetical protein
MKLGLATIGLMAALLVAAPKGAGADVIDVSKSPHTVRLDGQARNDLAGTSVANAGDVNGDGTPDFVVGVPNADSHSRHDSGSAFVVYGGNALKDVRHRKLGLDGFRIDGAAGGDNAGFSVSAAGDFNGDGVEDVIVGAPNANPGAMDNAGAAYVIYGQKTPDLANVDLARIKTTQDARGMEIDGGDPVDGAGIAVSGGRDLNFDQISDVIVGAPGVPDGDGLQGAGAAYEIWGQRTADPTDVDLFQAQNAQSGRVMEIDGASRTFIASAVAASRDLNDDGIADAVIGAPSAGPNMRNQSGAVYVIYGMNGDDPPDVDLSKIQSTQNARGMEIDGVHVLDGLGQSVADAGDINGDGINDAIMGAPRNRNDAGAAYVVYGQPGDAPDVDLAKLGGSQDARGMRIIGADFSDLAGTSVGGGRDVNGDRRPDVVVGAPEASDKPLFAGFAYVIFGARTADPADVQLSQIARNGSRGVRIEGAAGNDRLGSSVAGSAGDLNDDGRADVLVGAPQAHNNGPMSGSAYVVDLKKG